MDAAALAPIRIVMPDGAPKIVRREQLPDARVVVPVPLRAFKDRTLTEGELRFLVIMCSYANKGGLLWASLKRMAQDMGYSGQRAQVLAQKLEQKGYVKTIYRGFAGERANTRQIIFTQGATLEEIVRKTQDPAPYMLEKQEKAAQKRRKRLSAKTHSSDNVHCVAQPIREEDGGNLVELKKKVSDKVWDMAMSRTGNSNDYATVYAEIERLLR